MKDFGEFKIEPDGKGFKGEKISINKILNVNIVVEDYKIENSKFEGKGKRLDLQILVNNVQRVCWIGSKNLIIMIEQVPKNGFPFRTKIIKEESGRMVFTSAG
jgi:hypothetical protein